MFCNDSSARKIPLCPAVILVQGRFLHSCSDFSARKIPLCPVVILVQGRFLHVLQ